MYGSGRAFSGSLLLLLFTVGQIRQIASMWPMSGWTAHSSSPLRPALSTPRSPQPSSSAVCLTQRSTQVETNPPNGELVGAGGILKLIVKHS